MTTNVPSTQNQPPAEENRLSALMKTPKVQERFKEVLGDRTPVFMSSILSAYNANSGLKDAEPMSVIASAMIAATLKLPINSSLGFAHIVPYSGKAQFQMGWKGFVQLCLRTGQYRTINVALVYEGELVEYNRITGDLELNTNRKQSEKVVGYVAYFRLITGFEKYLFMSTEEVTAHGKKYSQTFKMKKGLWVDDFDAMALKTVIKMLLSKWGIMSVDIEQALEADGGVKDTIEGQVVYADNPADEKPKITGTEGPGRLKNIINGEVKEKAADAATDGAI